MYSPVSYKTTGLGYQLSKKNKTNYLWVFSMTPKDKRTTFSSLKGTYLKIASNIITKFGLMNT